MCLFVCLSVCPLSYLKIPHFQISQSFLYTLPAMTWSSSNDSRPNSKFWFCGLGSDIKTLVSQWSHWRLRPPLVNSWYYNAEPRFYCRSRSVNRGQSEVQQVHWICCYRRCMDWRDSLTVGLELCVSDYFRRRLPRTIRVQWCAFAMDYNSLVFVNRFFLLFVPMKTGMNTLERSYTIHNLPYTVYIYELVKLKPT